MQEGGEATVQKVLTFLEYGSQKESNEMDARRPFHRNTSKFGDLGLREIKGLFETFHGSLWAEQLASQVRLPVCRNLLCYALRIDSGDKLPRRCFADLAEVCLERYQEPPPQG